ncbi:MAG: hypothetical protein ACD_12C00658G0014 [uncultured bacterium]|nr:MAG: hypothetical protein ACD_12C00658G0014 [uncultured bacterium]
MNRFNWIKKILMVFFSFFLLANLNSVFAQVVPNPTETPPLRCPDKVGQRGVCLPELDSIYQEQGKGEACTTDYEVFKTDQAKYHFWIEDSEVTAQGKSNDRARQFIYWVTTHSGIDNHPVLTKIWSTTRNLSYFLVILTAALLGLGIIIGQKTNFETGIKLWPAVSKILLSIFYIAFSATIVISLIQLSEILMKFFIENLGGKDLFNIYFSAISQEKNYVDFVGCRDINIRVQEAAKTEMLLLKLTNWSYYFMGGMLLVRKIILWFLLFVSPFLAILLSFTFIKNVGMIWIGVFFQWVFYGPLLALFLGGLASIWKFGIPFVFDFSRVNTTAGYIYPTAISILYGGPAQKLGLATNNGNYIDTYVEYIITLIMLWAVTIFPWWLLRIYRDYCCEGINAMKNMMLAGLNPGHPSGPSPSPTPIPANINSKVGVEMKIPREIGATVKTRIETIEEIKKAKTEDISRSLNIKASNITDIANFETNKTLNETTNKNINYLKNPIQASTPAERQKYMNIRSELSSRASKSDFAARQVINVFTASKAEQPQIRQNIITTLPKMVPVTQIVSFKVKLPQAKVQEISTAIANTIINNKDTILLISQKSGIDPEKTTQVLNSFHQNINIPATEVVKKISEDTKIEKLKVTLVIKEFSKQIKSDTKMNETVAKENNLDSEQIKKVIEAQDQVISEPEKNIEQTITIPQTVSIDEYEQVKKMWIQQYEKGEVPVTENIKTRNIWVDHDIVFITNTLNKLFSPDVQTKQQGLDEVGYILPIFLVNNLSGEQLVTYLKAKIEAAKMVKALIDREKEVTERLKAKVEEVDVLKPKKKEAEKTMELKEELKMKE